MSKMEIDLATEEINSGCVVGPFDENVGTLTANGFSVISPEQYATMAISQGNNKLLGVGTRTNAAILHMPEKGLFLVNDYLSNIGSEEITEVHKSGAFFCPSPTQLDALIQKGRRIPNQTHLGIIPTERFGENPLTNELFGKDAQNYGLLLQDKGIKSIQAWTTHTDHVNAGMLCPVELWTPRDGRCHIFSDGVTLANPSGVTRGIRYNL